MALLSSLKHRIIGRKRLQPLFSRLHKLALYGMNYGQGGTVRTSGEEYVIRRIVPVILGQSRGPFIVLDVGAAKGEYSCTLARYLPSGSRVFCFEPAQSNYSALTQSVSSLPGFEVIRAAASNTAGKNFLYGDTPGSAWASLAPTQFPHLQKKMEVMEEVDVIRLEDFLTMRGVSEVGFLKLDIEGHEFEALQGLGSFLTEQRIGAIQFEIGLGTLYAHRHLHDFFELLSGYSIYRILQDGIARISYSERAEIFLTTNYLALHAKSEKVLGKICQQKPSTG